MKEHLKEVVGVKKFGFKIQTQVKTGLFKFKKDAGTTDHISECIAYKIAKLLEKGERDQCEELISCFFQSRLPDKKEKILKKSWKSINWKNMIHMSY